MALADAWIKTALTITGGIETSGDPFMGVSGDFDGMGISCGCLQWNIGKGSLQVLTKPVGKAVVTNNMPTVGEQMWQALNATIPDGLAIVRGWQTGKKLKTVPLAELRAFMGSPEMRQRQIDRIRGTATSAYSQATNWATGRGESEPTLKEFCWFFDLLTQNGGLGTLKLSDVKTFIARYGTAKVDDAICDWLAARTKADSGYLDSQANADLWRDSVSDDDLELFVLAYLRALNARTEYRGLVLNRKGAIAVGLGWINREKKDMRKLLQG